jgi:MFS family permease
MSEVGRPTYDKPYLWAICLVATLGGFLFGYDWVVVGGAKEFYEAYFGIAGAGNEIAKGWGTSSALIGCIIGAVGCSFVSDRFGRKRLLILSGLLFSVSAVGTGMADTFTEYNIYRIVGGVAMGIALNVSPLYIAEMSPPSMRGMMVSVKRTRSPWLRSSGSSSRRSTPTASEAPRSRSPPPLTGSQTSSSPSPSPR